MSRYRTSSTDGRGEDRSTRKVGPAATETWGDGGPRRRRSRERSVETPGARPGWVVALLAIVLFGGPIAWMLAGRGIGHRTHLLEHWAAENPNFLGHGTRVRSVPMSRDGEPADGYPHFIEFTETAALPREGLYSIGLQFDVRTGVELISERAGRTRLVRGELRDLDGGGVWMVSPGTRLRTEQLVEFVRAPGAGQGRAEGGDAGLASGTNQVHRWRLSIWTELPVQVGVRCHVTRPMEGKPSPAPGKWVKVIRSPDGAEHWAYPHGRYTTDLPEENWSRARLLAGVWGRSGAAWTWTWWAISVGAAATGTGLLAGRKASGVGAGTVRAGLAVGLAFFGFGSATMVLTPPYLGVDEPVHVLSSHVWLEDSDSLNRAWTFGKQSHFARLYGRTHQKITAPDIAEPHDWFIDSPANWGLKPLARSATDARLTRLTRSWVAVDQPGQQLLRMRLLRLLLVSLAVALGGMVLARRVEAEPGLRWLGWVYVMVGSLGYFAMTVSNYPLLLACFVVLSAVATSVVGQDGMNRWVMALAGLAIGLQVQTALNGVLLALVPAAALAGLAFFRPSKSTEGSEAQSEDRIGLAGWGALGAGLLLARVFMSADYDDSVRQSIGQKLTALTGIPTPGYLVWVVGACLVLALTERVASNWLRMNGGDGKGKGMVWVGGLAVAIALGLLINLILPAPQLGMLMEAVPTWEFMPNQAQLLPRTDLPVPPDPHPSPGQYALNVTKSFLASWGPGDADFMTSQLFWQSCGYLDTLAPAWVRWYLTTLLACGLALHFWRVAQRRNRVRFGRLVVVLGALVVTLALLAVGARSSMANPSIHGRYLLGIYVMLLPLGFSGWKGLLLHWEERRPWRLALLLIVPALAIQAATGVTMLERYFG